MAVRVPAVRERSAQIPGAGHCRAERRRPRTQALRSTLREGHRAARTPPAEPPDPPRPLRLAGLPGPLPCQLCRGWSPGGIQPCGHAAPGSVNVREGCQPKAAVVRQFVRHQWSWPGTSQRFGLPVLCEYRLSDPTTIADGFDANATQRAGCKG